MWDGIIFIRNGIYEKAKFKFQIYYPNNFPTEKPMIFFKSKVYHPLINFETGELDLNVQLLFFINSI